MTPAHPYIVLTPGMRANPAPKHTVVHVDEWLHVSLGEKDTYTFISEHDDYRSAAAERERLNHRPGVRLAKTEPLTETVQGCTA